MKPKRSNKTLLRVTGISDRHKLSLRLIFILALLFSPKLGFGQYYISAMPAFYTTAGNTAERITWDIEAGKQWSVFSLGLDIGKTSMKHQDKIDTTWYSEVRSNLNVFQQEKFTNTITIGCGYVFNAHENVMFEASTGIEYDINPRNAVNIFFGSYYFSGMSTASQQSFFGLSFVRYFGDHLISKTEKSGL